MKIGRIRGIELRLHFSWLFIFVLLAAALALDYFPSSYPNWPSEIYWLAGILTSLLIFACVLAHELAHSFASVRQSIPVSGITLFLFGGMAKISREPRSPSGEFKIAIAGPLCSFGIAALFALLSRLSLCIPLKAMFRYLCWMNLLLAAFNLLPGFPLDGGRILRSLVWWRTGNYLKATYVAHLGGRITAFVLMGGGAILMFATRSLDGLWLVLIGWLLHALAVGSYRQIRLREALAGLSASRILNPNPPSISPWATAERALEDLGLAPPPCALVVDEGRVKGVLVLERIRKMPSHLRSLTLVGRIMVPLEKVGRASPEAPLLSLLEEMEESGVPVTLITNPEGEVVGIVTKEEILRAARFRADLFMR